MNEKETDSGWDVKRLSDLKQLKKKAAQIRMDLLEMIYRAGGGHAGGSLSSVDILVTLYYSIMKLDPKHPERADRDRFILSKGHSVEGYYAILSDLGFFPREERTSYRKFRSGLIGHPSNHLPSIDVNTGSLGHGLSIGAGMALAGKMDQKDYHVYVLMGDGEQAEGSVWEAAMAASHYQLDHLTGIIDRNGLQISGDTEQVMALESLKGKWTSFGWEVVEVADGNNMEELLTAFRRVLSGDHRPHLVIANTIKGKGVSFMENQPQWHHKVPTESEMKQVRKELQAQIREVR